MTVYLKVWLDDVRPAPEDWVRCFWPDEVLALWRTGEVATISLDHDLGDDDKGTGYDVILSMEEYFYDALNADVLPYLNLPEILIHSANPVGRNKIARGFEQITKLAAMVKRLTVDPESPKFQVLQTRIRREIDGVDVRLLSAVHDFDQDLMRMRISLDSALLRATLDTENDKIRISGLDKISV